MDELAFGAARARVEQEHPRRWSILAVLCVSLILVVAANSGLNVALPTFTRRMGASQTQLQWIVDAYSIVFAALLLPLGALGDRIGRRRLLIGGLAVFAGANLGASLTSSATSVIVARVVMGVGAAAVMPATLSILTTVFPPSERPRAIAIWAGMAGAGAAAGPVASGGLLEVAWWGSVFLVNVPIASVGILGGLLLIPAGVRGGHAPIDLIGGLLATLGLSGIAVAIIEVPVRGLDDPLTAGGALLGLAGLAAFTWWGSHREDPMLDPDWLRQPTVALGAATVLVAFLVFIALMFLLTQYLQFVLGYSPLLAAVAALPVAAMMVTVAPRSSDLAERFGALPLIVVGFGLLAAGLLLLAVVSTTHAGYLPIGSGLLLAGTGLALSTPPATSLILDGVPQARAGAGSALNDTTRELGAALGVAALGSIVTALYRHGLATDRLPDRAADVALRSIGSALVVAERQPPEIGRALAETARQAFTDGYSAALTAGAAMAALAAIAVHLYTATHGVTPGATHPESNPQEHR